MTFLTRNAPISLALGAFLTCMACGEGPAPIEADSTNTENAEIIQDDAIRRYFPRTGDPIPEGPPPQGPGPGCPYFEAEVNACLVEAVTDCPSHTEILSCYSLFAACVQSPRRQGDCLADYDACFLAVDERTVACFESCEARQVGYWGGCEHRQLPGDVWNACEFYRLNAAQAAQDGRTRQHAEFMRGVARYCSTP